MQVGTPLARGQSLGTGTRAGEGLRATGVGQPPPTTRPTSTPRTTWRPTRCRWCPCWSPRGGTTNASPRTPGQDGPGAGDGGPLALALALLPRVVSVVPVVVVVPLPLLLESQPRPLAGVMGTPCHQVSPQAPSSPRCTCRTVTRGPATTPTPLIPLAVPRTLGREVWPTGAHPCWHRPASAPAAPHWQPAPRWQEVHVGPGLHATVERLWCPSPAWHCLRQGPVVVVAVGVVEWGHTLLSMRTPVWP